MITLTPPECCELGRGTLEIVVAVVDELPLQLPEAELDDVTANDDAVTG